MIPIGRYFVLFLTIPRGLADTFDKSIIFSMTLMNDHGISFIWYFGWKTLVSSRARISGGGPHGPPPTLYNTSKKPTSNRVNGCLKLFIGMWFFKGAIILISMKITLKLINLNCKNYVIPGEGPCPRWMVIEIDNINKQQWS